MSERRDVRFAMAALCSTIGVTWAAIGAAQSPLRLVQTIALPGVEGRIDHMALDSHGGRLFVAALGSNALMVVDVRAGRRIRSVTGFHEPQGVGFVASPPRVFVSNGGDGRVAVLDADSYRTLRTVQLGDDADNVRVDVSAGRVLVGFGTGGLATLDAATGELLGRIELPGHPEAFQLQSARPRVFVNVPDSNQVDVVDRVRQAVVARWRLDSQANFPMALDSAGHRVFVGCRKPAQLVVLDSETGRKLATLPIDGDVDDLYFDTRSHWLFASCGSGFVDVIEASSGGSPRLVVQTPTAAGARTSQFDPAMRRLYVAVPHRGARIAELQVFEVAQP